MNFCKGLRPAALPLALLLIAGLAVADTPIRDHQITAEDYFDLTILGNIAVSPDGQWVAYSESRWGQGKEGRSTDLWALRTDGRDMRRLTFDGFGAGHPQWNPRSDTIYFLGHRDDGAEKPPYDGSTQVWRVDQTHGLVAVTRHDGGVSDFQLDPAGRYLYYKVDDEVTDGPWAELKKKNSDLEFGHGVRTLHALRRLDLQTWRDQEIFPADRVIWEMSLAPDGKAMAMITTEDNELIFKEGWSDVEILDLESSAVTTITSQQWRDGHKSPYGWLEDLAWSADSRALAFAIAYDGYASDIWVTERHDAAWSLDRVQRPDMVTYSGGLRWRGRERTLCFKGESLARVGVYGIRDVRNGRQGKSRLLVGGDVVVGGFAFDARGRKLLAGLETPTTANDLYLIEDQTKRQRLTHLNPQVDTWILPRIQHVSWTGADGDKCYGILELPHDYQVGDGPLPTIIELHGGPTSSTKYRLRLWIYGRALMASNGYALLSPNYHGSTGYGDTFLEKLIGRENEIEVTDITAGTRWLIEQGIADPERIGVMGWSNGGYLTNCMIVAEPDLFAAASSGAGVLDMAIQWATEDTPGHVINYVQGLPWQQAEHYQKSSPLYHLDRVKTPTLIHVGGRDPRVPPAHSRALYRGLKHYLGVDCELIVYPGEPHGLTTHENRLAKITWDLAWFEKYLLGKED
ncbi:peptidase S9 [bacterium DOLZORAL124_64_63]|nr:MAG: peptidase S9 [bacterium DOLZORAL124_64_63]